MEIDAPALIGMLAAFAVLALGAVLLRGRAAERDAVVLLLGKVEALAAAQARQGEGLARLDAQFDARLARQEQALADRVASALRAQDETLGQHNERVNRTLREGFAATQGSAAAIAERLAVLDAARGNIEALGAQVGGLAAILSNKQSRGLFGEVQLQRLIEDRLPAGGYTWQATLPNGTRADCLIHLPTPPGPIVVDSKFPLENWFRLRDAADEPARSAAAAQFARDVRTHVADIAGKYILDGETAEGALLFLPSEAIYAELHANHPALIEEAVRRRVYIVSPTTMWAVLGTLAALLRDVRLAENVRVIRKEAGVLLNDVRLLGERVERLKGHFALAQQDVGLLEVSRERLLKSGSRIRDAEGDEAVTT